MKFEEISSYIQRGKSPKYSEIKKYPVISQKCVQWDGIKIENCKFITKESLLDYSTKRFLNNDDILWNSTGLGTLGRVAIYSHTLNPFSIAVADSHVTVIRLINIISKYVYFYLSSAEVQNVIEDKSDGSTKQKELSLLTIKNYLVPLPPLNEQKRIVAKIEELLPLIEQYDQKEQQLTQLNQDFPEQLKKSILQAAIQGKLTTSNPTDESASLLMEHIRAEKARLIAEKKIKKPKHERYIIRRDNSHYEIVDGVERCIDDELPFDIPENWVWVRLGELFEITSSKRVHQSEWKKQGIPFYRAREIVSLKKGEILKDPIYIDLQTYERNIKLSGKPEIGDILVTGVGTLGQTFLIEDSNPFYFKDGNVVWLKNFSRVYTGYILFFMDSPLFLDYIYSNAQGTTVGTLTIINAKNLLIPFPPLKEQKKIVEKIEKLFQNIKNL